MSMDTPRTLKDALTEAMQASLHALKGSNAELEKGLRTSLDEIYQSREVKAENISYYRKLIEQSRIDLDSITAAQGCVVLLDEALNALDAEDKKPDPTHAHTGQEIFGLPVVVNPNLEHGEIKVGEYTDAPSPDYADLEGRLRRVNLYIADRLRDYWGRVNKTLRPGLNDHSGMISLTSFRAYLDDISAIVTGDNARPIATDRVNVRAIQDEVTGIPPAVVNSIREKGERAIAAYITSEDGAAQLARALQEVCFALRDAAKLARVPLHLEVTEPTDKLLTPLALEAINTLYTALWKGEAERDINSSLALLNKVRAIVLDLDRDLGKHEVTTKEGEASILNHSSIWRDATALLEVIETGLSIPLKGISSVGVEVDIEALSNLHDEIRERVAALKTVVEEYEMHTQDIERDKARYVKAHEEMVKENNALRAKTTVEGYERLVDKLEKIEEARDLLQKQLEEAQEQLEKAEARIDEIAAWRTFALGRLKEAEHLINSKGQTVEALRQDNELLSRERELQEQSLISYMFIVNRLKGTIKVFNTLLQTIGKAIRLYEDGKITEWRDDYVGLDNETQGTHLLNEIKALCDSAFESGKGELELLARALPSVKMSTTEGLTED